MLLPSPPYEQFPIPFEHCPHPHSIRSKASLGLSLQEIVSSLYLFKKTLIYMFIKFTYALIIYDYIHIQHVKVDLDLLEKLLILLIKNCQI